MHSRVAEIVDDHSGSTARILVGPGFNCFSWRPAMSDGPRDMLWAEPGFESGWKQPLFSGIPILFPFPGRIGGTTFAFDGHEYQLAPGNELGNALHGFVYTRPWRISEQSANRVVGEFQASVDDDTVLGMWPTDFRIRVAYEVRGCDLLSHICCENMGKRRMPYGFGTHPYFRLPLANNSEREQTRVIVPATEMWEEENLLMTGRRLPASGAADLHSGGALAGRSFDIGYTNLQFDSDDKCRTRLIDSTGRTLVQEVDRSFTQCVVYTPPHRAAICLEPWTGLADTPSRRAWANHPVYRFSKREKNSRRAFVFTSVTYSFNDRGDINFR